MGRRGACPDRGHVSPPLAYLSSEAAWRMTTTFNSCSIDALSFFLFQVSRKLRSVDQSCLAEASRETVSMTIFSQRRSAAKPVSTEPPPSSMPRASHRMDDYLFDDINWPEDDELMIESCEIEARGLSTSSNRGSELDLCRNESRWMTKVRIGLTYYLVCCV
jgi:hypothetical protein